MSKAIAFAKKLGGKLSKTKLGQNIKAGSTKAKDLKDRGLTKLWLQNKFRIMTSESCVKIIPHHSKSEANAFENFFKINPMQNQ